MPERSLALTLTGQDRPGLTSRLFDSVAAFDVTVADVEQVVLNGRLTLGVLLDMHESAQVPAIRQAISTLAASLDLAVEITEATPDIRPVRMRRQGALHICVLGAPLRPHAMAGVTGLIAEHGANIDRIERLAAYPLTCVEMTVSGADTAALRAGLAQIAAQCQVDVAVQPAGLLRRAKRLIVMDVDSTLIQGEVIELLAAHAGCLAEVTRVTEAAMRGELDFTESLIRRVALLQGLPVDVFDKVADDIVLTAGARTLVRTLKRLDYRFAIVSGGFTQITDRLVDELGLDYSAANTLEVANGVLTGRVVGEIVDRAGKARALRRFAAHAGVALGQTVAVGDGANDLDMLAAAGLGIAFNAKPVVREAAHAALNMPYLDSILYVLGISREEVEAADAADNG